MKSYNFHDRKIDKNLKYTKKGVRALTFDKMRKKKMKVSKSLREQEKFRFRSCNNQQSVSNRIFKLRKLKKIQRCRYSTGIGREEMFFLRKNNDGYSGLNGGVSSFLSFKLK